MNNSYLLLPLFLLTSCLPSSPDQVRDKKQWVETMAQTLVVQNPDVTAYTVEQVKQIIDHEDHFEIVFIDVRTLPERQVSTLPGADDGQKLAQRMDNERELWLFYCTNGERSVAKAREAAEKGAPHVGYLKGGVLLWAHEGQIFVDSKGHETREVHVFSKAWNFLPEGYHAHLP